MSNGCYDRERCQSDMIARRSKINMKHGEWKESYIKLSLMLSIVPLYPWCVCSIMAQSRDGLSLSFLSLCLLLVCCGKRQIERGKWERRKTREVAGDWTYSLHTQLKDSSAQRRSLPTCALTFVFLNVVIYSTMELKAKFATAQLQRPHSVVGLLRTGRKDRAGGGLLWCFYHHIQKCFRVATFCSQMIIFLICL